MAIATSAAIKCEYCVMAQKRLARAAGATEEEIRTALLLAADLQFRSTMLYGHEYSEEDLEAQIKQMTGG
jgi:AhpD family alkylhydroperoxidase